MNADKLFWHIGLAPTCDNGPLRTDYRQPVRFRLLSRRPEPGDSKRMCGIPTKESRDRLDSGLVIPFNGGYIDNDRLFKELMR